MDTETRVFIIFMWPFTMIFPSTTFRFNEGLDLGKETKCFNYSYQVVYRISLNILLFHSFVVILQHYVFYSKIVFDIWFQIFTLPWCEKVSTFAKNKDISAFLNGLWPRSTSKSKPCKTKSFKNGSDSVVDHI